MLARIASLLRISEPVNEDRGLLFDSGDTVPPADTDGYQGGAIFQKTDGGAGTTFYVNEGSVTSSLFVAFVANGTTQTITGTKTFSVMPILPAASVAATGSIIGDAAQIATGITWATGADAAKGVKLPSAVAGLVCIVKNDDTANAVLKIWPTTGDTINAIAASTSISLAAKTSAVFACLDGTAWFTVPLLPS